ncbi:MAG: response regulator [Granulosicoccus sp.]
MNSTYTVLIVDDNFEDRFLLKRYLKKTGLSLIVLEVSSGLEGIELLKTPLEELEVKYPGIRVPITLFLDINMPLMNGWQFLEELESQRKDIKLDPTVVMMYSTSDDSYDRSKAESYDSVANYIVKGESTPDSLKEAILSRM